MNIALLNLPASSALRPFVITICALDVKNIYRKELQGVTQSSSKKKTRKENSELLKCMTESTSSPQADEVSAMNLFLISHQGAGNMTYEIPRLRSGSVRLDNFISLSFLKL
jgi:hypothetical protein